MSNQRNFNGSTFLLGNSTQGKITKIEITQGGEKVPVYEPGDLCKLFELGIPDFGLSIGLAGTTAPTQGASGVPSITLGNGNSLTLPTNSPFQCMKVSLSGQTDGAWSGTAEYAPTTS
ncbi:MAG: hypothetical protein ABSA30_00025 [Candidatus Aminicenantales bacterium]|jgi:hypothetical protein